MSTPEPTTKAQAAAAQGVGTPGRDSAVEEGIAAIHGETAALATEPASLKAEVADLKSRLLYAEVEKGRLGAELAGARQINRRQHGLVAQAEPIVLQSALDFAALAFNRSGLRSRTGRA